MTISSPGSLSASFAPLVLNGQPVNGGFNLNFALPNMSEITNQAYNFVKSGSAQAFGFLNQTISQQNNFLQSQTAPIIAGAMNQAQANTTALIPQALTMEQQLAQSQQGYEAALANASITAQQNISLASINSSTASANAAANSGGGGCYITTAVCESEGLPDDCYTLTKFRQFRDEVMMKHGAWRELVREYYECAPEIVKKLSALNNAAEIYRTMRVWYLNPILDHIERGQHTEAIERYRALVAYAQGVVA